jgi:2-polyprenyl-3-methyl-5-hydroxy-6-metoxy-1,4-benzoquinol methylase
MVFLWPQPDETELRKIYRPSYHQNWGVGSDVEGDLRAMKQKTFQRQLDKVSHLVATGRVLDVGCATGFFLEVVVAAGWDVYGVELSEYAAGVARRTFGERVFHGTLEQARFSDGMFDLVTLSDLLEHIPDVRGFLSEVRRVLRPGGIVQIVTPDVASLSSRVMGRRWSHYNQEHLHYFSRTTVVQLLSENGFKAESLAAASKYLSAAYIDRQFRVYRHPLISPLFRAVTAILPVRLKELSFPVYCGEMLIHARRI